MIKPKKNPVMKSGKIKVDGVWYHYEASKMYGMIYHSFDGGLSWHATKKEAFDAAQKAGNLLLENPYKMRKLPGYARYRVRGSKGEIRTRATTKEKAEAQVRLLRGLEHGMIPRGNPVAQHKGYFIVSKGALFQVYSKGGALIAELGSQAEAVAFIDVLSIAKAKAIRERMAKSKVNPLTREEASAIMQESSAHRRLSHILEALKEKAPAYYYSGMAEGMRDIATEYREHHKRNPSCAHPVKWYRSRIFEKSGKPWMLIACGKCGSTLSRAPLRGEAKKLAKRGGLLAPARFNPSHPYDGAVLIYSRALSVRASKAGMPHHCYPANGKEPSCKDANHEYVHKVEKNACVYGLKDGNVLLTTKKL